MLSIHYLLFGESRVDDEDDSVDGERRLCDVGRHDDLPSDSAVRLPPRRGLKNPEGIKVIDDRQGWVVSWMQHLKMQQFYVPI